MMTQHLHMAQARNLVVFVRLYIYSGGIHAQIQVQIDL